MRNYATTMKALLLTAMAVVTGVGSAATENRPTGLMCELMGHPERTVITDAKPDFCWMLTRRQKMNCRRPIKSWWPARQPS